MSQAKITNKDGFYCYPDGVTRTHFAFNQVVTGKVAEWALSGRYAVAMLEKKPMTEKLETNAKRRVGGKK